MKIPTVKFVEINKEKYRSLYDWYHKWFVMNKKERTFLWSMGMLSGKYDYACFIEGRDLTFNEFLDFCKIRNIF